MINLRDSVRNSTINQRRFVEQTWPGSLKGNELALKESVPINERHRMWDLLQLSLFELTAMRHQMRILNYFIRSRKTLSGTEISAELAKTRILSFDEQTMFGKSAKPLGALRSVRKQLGTDIAALEEFRGEQIYLLSQL